MHADDRIDAKRSAAPKPDDERQWLDLASELNASGNELRKSGDFTGAKDSYRRAYTLLRRCSLARSTDAALVTQASLSLQGIADVLIGQGDLNAASAVLRQALECRRRLAAMDQADPQRRRDVADNVEQLGSILALKSSVSNFLDRRATTARSPAQAADQTSLRDLQNVAATLEARGDFSGALALYRECLAVQRTLVARSPADAAPLFELSCLLAASGRAHKAQGDLSGALLPLAEALAIRRTLAAKDADHAAPQLDLSYSLMAIAEIFEAKANFERALAYYREATDTRRMLLATDRDNNGLRCDLVVSLIKVGEILLAQADIAAAAETHREALQIARVAAENKSAQWAADLSALEEHVAALDREQRG